MATSEQVKSLIRAHYEENEEKFKTTVLQIAASEAKHGHDAVARELKKLSDQARPAKQGIIHLNHQNPMLRMTMPKDRLEDLVVSEDLSVRIRRILSEHRNRNKLQMYGLCNRRKILLEGRPGTGKTFTASVIASELDLPLYTVLIDKLVTKFMGETSARLRDIFDSIENMPGVYLFDEFDAIGADRSLDNEVGEMRRILNSFLQFIESDGSESIIIAATNNQKLLDQALYRRFDDVLHYSLPGKNEIRRLFESRLQIYMPSFHVHDALIEAANGLSQAEIIRISEDAIKYSILSIYPLNDEVLIRLIRERADAYMVNGA